MIKACTALGKDTCAHRPITTDTYTHMHATKNRINVQNIYILSIPEETISSSLIFTFPGVQEFVCGLRYLEQTFISYPFINFRNRQ